MTTAIQQIMRTSPVIPVLVIDDVAHAESIARALVAGGLKVLEVTLRTACALDAIAAMKRVPGAIVGAGTVLNPQDLAAAIAAGSEFIVSPGLTDTLGKAAVASGIPFLPGVANAADIMRGLDLGIQILPRRNQRRTARAERLVRPLRPGPLLSDRRHHAGERARVAGARVRPVRRRQLDGAQRRAGCRGDRSSGQRSGGTLISPPF